MKFYFRKRELEIRQSVYKNNNRVALVIVDVETGENFATLTVNVTNVNYPEDVFAIKTWSENEEVAEVIFNTDAFEDTGRRAENGHVIIEFWRLKPPYSLSHIPFVT